MLVDSASSVCFQPEGVLTVAGGKEGPSSIVFKVLARTGVLPTGSFVSSFSSLVSQHLEKKQPMFDREILGTRGVDERDRLR
jgi:hypothetical protein